MYGRWRATKPRFGTPLLAPKFHVNIRPADVGRNGGKLKWNTRPRRNPNPNMLCPIYRRQPPSWGDDAACVFAVVGGLEDRRADAARCPGVHEPSPPPTSFSAASTLK